jgi:1-acyl-sn-glycerol-3-phosphate acyltransferase
MIMIKPLTTILNMTTCFVKMISKITSKSLLFFLGWKPLDPKIMAIMNESPYLVCVFSHTSYYDFFFMILYYCSYYESLKNLRTLIKPNYFQTIGWFLYKIGGIPSTNIANKNGGNTGKIVENLKSEPKGQLLISPKGTILKGEWRTGYYHIAKELDAKLIAIGVDYETKQIKVGQLIDNDLDELEIKHKLYKDLSTIVPLYPEREMMKIKIQNKNDISVIHTERIIGYYFTMISLLGVYILIF